VLWIVAGVAMAAIFYQPAFAALTRWYSDDRVHALTVLTLAAGFSSTIFAPLTGALVSRYDWRTTYLVLAVLLAVVTIPLHAWFLRPQWPEAPRPADSTVVAMVLGSPPWKPHAMLADVTQGNTASSSPTRRAPKLSPMSQLMSTAVILTFLLSSHVYGGAAWQLRVEPAPQS